MNPEIIILALLFTSALIVLFNNLKLGIYVLLVISMFLHKELFSIYRWDLLPVRIFMLAFVLYSVFKFFMWLWIKKDWIRLKELVLHPFILTLLGLWLARSLSLVKSLNLPASVLMLGFFTTIVVLAIHLFIYFENKPDLVLRNLKFYFWVVASFVLFAVVQFILNIKFGWIYGALWNVPGHWPRVGSLFWDVNHFGGLLAAIIPIGASFLINEKGLPKKLLYFLTLAITLVILVLTNSRTAWIGFGTGFLVFATLFMFRWIKLKGILIVLASILVVSVPLYFELSNKSSPLRAVVKQYFHYRIDSFNSHFYLLKGAAEIFGESPVLGGGYGSFYEHFIKTDVADRFLLHDPVALNNRVPAHTIWGEVLAETGYTGTLLFLVFLTVGLLPLFYLSVTGRSKKEFVPAIGILSGLIGWLAAGTFYSYNAEFFWLIFIMGFLFGINQAGKESYEKIFSWFVQVKGLGFLILVFLSVILLFSGLGKNHLLPWDEAIYSQIAKNMTESGEYIEMQWVPGKTWYEKPPLGMWFIASSFKLLGVSEFAARLPSALLGLGAVVFVYILATKMFNKTAGFIAGLSLITTFNFLYYARASMLDITLSFFITGALMFYWIYREKSKYIFYVLSAVFTGLAVMTKGVIGFIPLTVIGLFEFYLVFSRQRKFSWRWILEMLGYFLISACVFLPWHLEMYRRFGQQFIENYIGYHVLDRATTSIEDKGAPWWYYIVVTKVSMRIWFIGLIPSLAFLISRLVKNDRKWVFLTIWSALIFALFTFSVSKLKWYIVPFYPAASIIISGFAVFMLDMLFSRLKNVNFLKYMALLALTTFSLSYLFVERDLIYESDLTGSQAMLLQKKDRLFGTTDTIYADRIDKPLVLFYSDSEFEVVDFTPLKSKLTDISKGDRKGVLYFITKESRFYTLKKDFEDLQLVDQNNEWVLGLWSAEYSFNSSKQELELKSPVITAQ